MILKMPRPEIVKQKEERPQHSCMTCHFFRFVGLNACCAHLHVNSMIFDFTGCGYWSDRFEKKEFAEKIPINEQLNELSNRS